MSLTLLVQASCSTAHVPDKTEPPDELHSTITKSRRNRVQLQQSNSDCCVEYSGLSGECHWRTAHVE